MQESNYLFSIEGKSKNMFWTNVFAFIFICLLLFKKDIFELRSENIFYFVFISIGAIYLILDYVLWNLKGIHKIDVYNDHLTFYMGKSKIIEDLYFTNIKRIIIKSEGFRETINILLNDTEIINLFPGIEIYSGKRYFITNDSFNEKDFMKFRDYLESLNLK